MHRFRLLAPLFLLAPALTVPLAGCASSTTTTDPTAPVVAATVQTTTFAPSLGIDLTAAGWTTTPAGLYYRTVTAAPATAAVVAAGQQLSVAYTGWLSTGTKFDSGTFPFTLGAGATIAGFDQGVAGMRVGETRRLLIPPSLGYGAAGYGAIPGNAVLVFDVTVLSAT